MTLVRSHPTLTSAAALTAATAAVATGTARGEIGRAHV